MPNIKNMQVDPNQISITASNNRTFILSKVDILLNYNTQTGTPLQRVAKTIAWIKNKIVIDLGEGMIDLNGININFNSLNGSPNLLEITDI